MSEKNADFVLDEEKIVASFSLKDENSVNADFSLGEQEQITADFDLIEEEISSTFILKDDEKISPLLKIDIPLTNHNSLNGRDEEDCHSIGSITGLKNVLNGKQDVINDLDQIRAGANLGSTSVQPKTLNNYATKKEVSEKQDIITDLSEIRTGAGLGMTAVQPETLDSYATKQELSTKQDIITDLSAIRSGSALGATAVQPTRKINNKPLSSDITLTNTDVGALSINTKYGSSLSLSINEQTYVLTAQLKDQNGENLGTAQTVDLPLETMVVGAEYDETTKEIVLTLQNGESIRFSVADLVSGLQPTISDLDEIRQGASLGETAVQPDQLSTVATSGSYNDLTNKPTIPTVNNGTLTIQKNGATVATFSANQSGNVTANIEADTQVNADWNATSGVAQILNKPTIPTQTSQLTNNSDFTTKAYVDGLVGDIETILININSGG